MVKERTRNINRIRGLLNLHNVRSVPGLHGGDWRSWLEAVRTGDGRRLGPFLVRELSLQYERLHLIIEQILMSLEARCKALSLIGGHAAGPYGARKSVPPSSDSTARLRQALRFR